MSTFIPKPLPKGDNDSLVAVLEQVQQEIFDEFNSLESSTGSGGGSTAWADITGKPSTFTPSSHTHLSAEITDLDTPVYDLVKAKGNIAGVSFDDTENAIAWNSPAIGSGSPNISISGSQITIDADGTYKFMVTLRTDSANRTELFIRTYINTGSGLTQDTSEIVSDYVSRDTDQDTGAVSLMTALELTDGDVVEFRGFGDTDGTCVGLDAGTILLVERVA